MRSIGPKRRKIGLTKTVRARTAAPPSISFHHDPRPFRRWVEPLYSNIFTSSIEFRLEDRVFEFVCAFVIAEIIGDSLNSP